MSKKSKENTVNSTEETPRFDKLADTINSILGATINMHSKINLIAQSVQNTLVDFKIEKEELLQRMDDIKESRLDDLTASSEAIQSIEQLEREGVVLEGKALTAHILGSLQNIYEVLGTLNRNFEETKEGVKILDKTIIEMQMNSVLMREQMTDMKKMTLPMLGRLIKLVAIAIAVIAAFVGLGTFIDMFRWWV